MTFIKICGITNLEDALTAVEAGVDALGFVFYEKSPRCVDADSVRHIVDALPERIEKVGVFVNRIEEPICHIADRARLTAVQFHGDDEDPHVADLVIARRPQLKALAGISMMREKPEDQAMMWNPETVYAFLADSGGGTGRTFDWSAGKSSLDKMGRLRPIAIAGGLNSGNVGDAITLLRPWGVDVSSGVESSPGKKDPEKIRSFVKAVRSAEKVQ